MKSFILAFCCLLGSSLACAEETAYFVVGVLAELDQVPTNAFLLPLTRADDIAHARKLAAMRGSASDALWIFSDLSLDPVPTFRIGLGSDGINRDVGTPGEPAWSWHVKKLAGWFTSSIPEYPYKNPRQIEEGVRSGAIQEDQQVSPVNATVLAEYNPEVALFVNHMVSSGSQQHFYQFYWTHRAFGEDYAVEWTPVLDPPDWRPVVEPPLNGYRYPFFQVVAVTSPQPPHGFFRLRAGPPPP